MIQEIYHLLDRQSKTTKAIEQLIKEFSAMLPNHFSAPYFVPSPLENLNSVLRANCSNSRCSVIAVVHLEREKDGILRIKEQKPLFDRFSNPCDLCKKLQI